MFSRDTYSSNDITVGVSRACAPYGAVRVSIAVCLLGVGLRIPLTPFQNESSSVTLWVKAEGLYKDCFIASMSLCPSCALVVAWLQMNGTLWSMHLDNRGKMLTLR